MKPNVAPLATVAAWFNVKALAAIEYHGRIAGVAASAFAGLKVQEAVAGKPATATLSETAALSVMVPR